ncbi:MAG: AAA domain-containing protein [Bacillota bacterium]|nr:AAA domain-containing protein [Bacillota bacterium]
MPRIRTVASGPAGVHDPAALPHHLSPSRVARYFYHQCPRHLRYHATPSERRAVEGIPNPPYDSSPVTQAILDGGYVWEARVVESIIRGRVLVNSADDTVPLRDRVFSAAATLGRLGSLEPGQFLYQGTLIAPPTLYAEFGLDPAAVQLMPCRPDLVQLNAPGPDDTASLRVLDLKASTSLKTSHRVQVGFYAMILSHAMAASGLDRTVDRDAGGVWLFGRDAPEMFDLRTVLPHLAKLLREDLPGVLGVPAGDVPWHFSYRCEWCEYFEHCGAEAGRSRSVSLMSYLTTPGRNHLRTAAGVNTLAEMASFLSRPDAPAVLAGSASLAGRKDRLEEGLRSLTSGEVRRYGAASVAMPKGENIRLLLTAQREPVSGVTYAAALLRTGGAEVFSSSRHETQFVAASQDDCGRVQREFIEELYLTLRAVHDFNQGRGWTGQKSLQAYVFDSYERELLIELLQAGLRDPAVAEKALGLLFHFHSECLVIAQEHPAEETDFPLIVLSGVIRALFALPLPVSYHLADVVRCLPPAGDREPFDYRRSDYFDFRLSNALRSDAIFAAWHKGSGANLERVAVRLRMRLWAASSVVDGIRAAATEPAAGRPLLFAWPPKFKLPAVRAFRHPLLSRAAFIARYESMLSYLEVRAGRALPRAGRELSGQCLRLRAASEANWFEAEPHDGAVEFEPDSYGRWLLTEDSWEGEQAQLAFPDQRYPYWTYVPKGHAVVYAALEGKRTGPDGRIELKLALTVGRDSPAVLAGRRYLLHRSFVDANSGRTAARLAEVDAHAAPAAVALLADPVGGGTRPPGRPDTAAAARLLCPASGMFTPGQERAFDHALQHSLTLVWGPPGTGKTYFLAQAVHLLLGAARQLGQDMRVLVTANTHAAIENCLRKIADLQNAHWARPPLIKLGPIQTAAAQGAGLESVPPKDGCYFLSRNPCCVVGGTTFAMLRMFERMPGEAPFDVVVFDEGAQVRVPESLLAISRLAPGGRLVVAGDDLQLPPIIKGVYPPPESGQPPLHRSVFEVLREPDRGKDLITVQLLENFRMNDSLCRFPASALYGPGYRSVSEAVAARRLRLAPAARGGERWLEEVLDPAYPWVLCVLEGVQAGAENRVEAGLVAAVARSLRARLCLDGGGPLDPDAGNDRRFWRDGLFIVSPHHVQIRAIRRALADLGLRPPFFVDTVDKMQGQECESVIVSYGLSDSEQAMQEGEFIYNLNRLNVAVTRARSKCVVFLPRPLLEPPLQVLELDDAMKGINYMLQLEKHVSSGERLVHDIEPGRLVVYRAR